MTNSTYSNTYSNNVIGPIGLDDWYLMRMLRESVNHMKKVDSSKYRLAIDIHSKTYKDTLRSYL